MFRKLVLMICLCFGMSLSVNLRDTLLGCLFGPECTPDFWKPLIAECKEIVDKARRPGTDPIHITLISDDGWTIGREYSTLYQQHIDADKIIVSKARYTPYVDIVNEYSFDQLPEFIREYSKDFSKIITLYTCIFNIGAHCNDIRPLIRGSDLTSTPFGYKSNEEYRAELENIIAHEDEASENLERLISIIELFCKTVEYIALNRYQYLLFTGNLRQFAHTMISDLFRDKNDLFE